MGAKHALSVAALPILYLAHASSAHAGGFMLQEQSTREIGRAFAGAAAAADDPSTIFYNPAGMTELDSVQISSGGALLFIDSNQRDLGTTRTGPGLTPTLPVGGSNGGNPFKPVVAIPNFYMTAQSSDRLWAGIGISSPFGLKLDYDPDFFGRYESLYSNLLTLDGQFSLAYKISDSVSLGGGLNVQYVDAKLTSALPSLAPGQADGINIMKGDDLSLGWNAGLLVKIRNGVRVGLSYRSRVKHEIKGDYYWELAGTVKQFGVRTPLKLPDTVTASISIPLDRKTRLMGTARHYNWSTFDALRLHFSIGATGVRYFNYHDSWSLSAGLEREVSEKLTLCAGTMFDRTPTNGKFLSTRVPDGNRIWASGGLSYKLNSHMTLNASYAHVFIRKQDLLRTDSFYTAPILMTSSTRARSSGNVDMIATAVDFRF